MRPITSRLLAELYAGESSAVLVPLVKLVTVMMLWRW